jgi:pilus assembly protein CpaF
LPDKSRKVLEISEIAGYHDGKICINPLFKYIVNMAGPAAGSVPKGRLMPTGNALKKTLKLEMNGVSL